MANFFPFLAYVFVTTFTPGPNNLLAMSNGMRFGYRRTLGFLAGMTTGFMLIMLACGLLNVVLVTLLPQVKIWMEILGAVYMIYLAVHIIRAGPLEEGAEETSLSTFAAGFALQFLNVKAILYGVTVFSLFITPAFHDPAIVSLFAPLLAVIGFSAISCWALGGNLFRHALRRHYRLFNLAMAALLIYPAIAALVPHN
jgi:cysteine/O-acetylserine efflux protein